MLTIDHRDGVTTLAVDRPERRNAFGVATVEAFHEALDALDARVLVLGGAGDFSTGADLHERREMDTAAKRAHSAEIARLVHRVAALEIPTIACIGGYALGGGCELALACDLRVVSEQATLGLTEVTIGAFPGAGGTSLLTRITGPAVAKDLIFTGRKIDAAEAQRLGLVTRLTDDPVGTTQALAAAIAANGPVGLRFAKQAIDRAGEAPLQAGLAFEAAAGQVVLASEDYQEGITAFAERRTPTFKGR